MASNSETLNLKLKLSGIEAAQAGIKAIANQIGAIKPTAIHVLEAITAAAGVGGFERLAHSVLGLGSELNVLKLRVGATIPQLMAMRKLLVDNGGSADELATLLGFMQRAIVEAAEKGGPLAKFFSDIQLDAEKLSALGPGEQFQEIAKGIASLDNPAKRLEVTRGIFGRSGGDLIAVFSDLGKINDAFESKSPFVAAMTRSSEAFHEAEVAIRRFAMNGTKMMAGFLDQLVPQFQGAFEQLGKIDLTVIGQKLGALFGVIIEAGRNDKFPEMLGLLIEAGFEIGTVNAQKVWSDWINDSFELSLLNGVMTFGSKIAQALVTGIGGIIGIFVTAQAGLSQILVDVFETAFTYAIALALKLGNVLQTIFAVSVNTFTQGLLGPLNLAIAAFNKISGSKIEALNFGKVDGGGDMSFADAKAKGAALAKPFTDGFREQIDNDFSVAFQIIDKATKASNKWLQAQLEISRVGIGIMAGGGGLSAMQRLLAMMADYQSRRAAMAEKDAAAKNNNQAITDQRQLRDLDREETKLKEHLVEIQARRALVDTSFAITEVDKYKERMALLLDEKATIQQIVDLDERRAALLDKIDPARADQARKRADGERAKLPGVDREIGKLGANPESFGEQFRAESTKLFDQWGTLAKSAATSFGSVFNAAISTISSGITGLITGTKSWGQALRQIGATILTDIIQAIVQMGVRWVLTQILMAVAGKAILASATAATTPIAAAQSLIWAVPATLATIASYGGAAEAAPGLIALAQAFVLGQTALTGFASGGYTGSGPSNQPAGIVHAGEWVMPADATRRIGLPALQAIQDGQALPVTAAGGGGDTHIHFWENADAMQRHIRENPGVQHAVVDSVMKRAYKFGRRR